MTARHIFVSYSRRDRDVVKILAAGMKLGGAVVFRDEDSLEPGEEWAEALARNIEACDCIALFWSANAAASEQVAAEMALGLHHKKTIAPLLLDKTPLPEVLRRFQWLDCCPYVEPRRDAVATTAGPITQPVPSSGKQDWKAYLPYLIVLGGISAPVWPILEVAIPVYLKLKDDKARQELTEKAKALFG